MPDMTDDPRTLPQLFTDLSRDLSTLFGKEAQLIRAELSDKAGEIAKGLAAAAMGAVLVLAAVILVLHAAALALSTMMGMVWAYLIVAFAAGVAGWLALQAGLKAATPDKMKLEATQRQLAQDMQIAKGGVS